MKLKVILLLVLIVIVGVSSSMISQNKAPAPKPQKAIDPVCGLSVDKVPELSYTYKGETFYFCAKADLKTFKDNPDKYPKKTAPTK